MVAFVTAITSVSLFLVGYLHAWPMLARRLARRLQSARATIERTASATSRDRDLPSVALVVPALNEAKVIAAKIRNLASLDYPPNRLRVLVACDGCTDDTATLARAVAAEPECRHLTVCVAESSPNRGKLTILNEITSILEDEIIALSDASALISVDALKIAARYFENATVGAVCGTYALLDPGSAGEAAYWAHQVDLKISEAALGAPIGAHGAFYMFRRSVFRKLAYNTINDDFALPMNILLAGHRVIYSDQIIAVELEHATRHQDWRRRQRIGAGNMQQLIRFRYLLHPRHRGIALAFGSGKALRAVMPFVLIVSLLGSLWLASSSTLFAIVASCQLAVYGIAALRNIMPGIRWPRVVEVINYVVCGHLAGLLGATRYLSGREPQARSSGSREQSDAAAANAGETAQPCPPKSGSRRDHPAVTHGQGPVTDRYGGHVHPAVASGKQCFDIVAACSVLLLTAPILLLIALAIRLDSPGPIIFRQLRVGESTPQRRRLFWILKFRTMRMAVPSDTEARWAEDNDERITRVGRFLRRARLDELPQLVNVLKGEMSIIGPRPEQPSIVPRLEASIPYYGERIYFIRPGITGFAQVHQGYDRTIDDVRAKLNYDHAYAIALSEPHAWLSLELHIVRRTLLVMATAAGH